MKKPIQLVLALMLSLGSIQYARAQSETPVSFFLPTPSEDGNVSAQRKSAVYLDLPLPGSKKVRGKINYNKLLASEKQNLAGSIDGIEGSSFYLRKEGKTVEGNIVLKNDKKAYSYFSNAQGTFVKEVPLETVLCIEYNTAPAKSLPAGTIAPPVAPAVQQRYYAAIPKPCQQVR